MSTLTRVANAMIGGLLVTLGTAGTAEAKVIPEVKQFLNAEIGKQAAVEQLRAREGKGAYRAFAAPLEAGYAMSTFALRVRGELGFSVGFADVKVVPSVEFFWME